MMFCIKAFEFIKSYCGGRKFEVEHKMISHLQEHITAWNVHHWKESALPVVVVCRSPAGSSGESRDHF